MFLGLLSKVVDNTGKFLTFSLRSFGFDLFWTRPFRVLGFIYYGSSLFSLSFEFKSMNRFGLGNQRKTETADCISGNKFDEAKENKNKRKRKSKGHGEGWDL